LHNARRVGYAGNLAEAGVGEGEVRHPSRDFLKAEVGQLRFAVRSESKDDLATSSHAHNVAFPHRVRELTLSVTRRARFR
jgi:hypothetical protein